MEGGENAMMLNLRESNHGQQKDVGKGTEVQNEMDQNELYGNKAVRAVAV